MVDTKINISDNEGCSQSLEDQMTTFGLNDFKRVGNGRHMGLTFLLATMLTMLCGCSHTEKVVVPPLVNLQDFNGIGIIEFSTNAEDTLEPYVTRRFIQSIQSAQPGTRILELGSEERVLRSINRPDLDLEAIKLIGNEYHVEALILGHLDVSELMPKIKAFSAYEAMQAQIHIEAALQTRIVETRTGATVWTHSNSGKSSVARLTLTSGGSFDLGVSDPKEKYGKLVPDLVYINTSDLRCTYEYRKVN
jgi:hypothetical protein